MQVRIPVIQCLMLSLLACSGVAAASTFPLPDDGSTIVGEIRVVTPTPDNTLLDIARHFDVGYDEITNANPGMSVWTPGQGAQVVVLTPTAEGPLLAARIKATLAADAAGSGTDRVSVRLDPLSAL